MLSNDNFPTPTIGVSSCLIGHEVRFDGGHKQSRYILDTLSKFFELQAYCPEVAIGLGIPRPSIRLVTDNNSAGETISVINPKDPEVDYADQLHDYAVKVADTEMDSISGYIFKRDSPSCGMTRIRVYSDVGEFVHKDGVGIYAKHMRARFPHMPMEEEGRLNDTNLRENFLTRVYIYHAWLLLRKEGLSAGKLVAFHSDQKYLLMAHDQDKAKEIGQLVAKAGTKDIEKIADEYIQLLMDILSKQVNRNRHTNVLQHLMGYLSKDIDANDKQELLQSIFSYQKNEVPLIMPLTLLKHHFTKFPNPYISTQRYLSPYPIELGRDSQ